MKPTAVKDDPTTASTTVATEQALVPGGTQALATTRPSYIKDGNAGKENITRDDMTLPRLAICQSTTPQRKKTDPLYVPGIEEGDLFNTLTGRIYAKHGQTVTVVPVRHDKRALVFNGSGKGVAEFDVAWDDPRCEFTGDTDNRVKPVATRFHDYICVIPGTNDIVVLSFKSTYMKAAKRFNSLVNARAGDIYAGAYVIGSVPDAREKGDFFNFTVNYSPVNDGWADDLSYARAEKLHTSLKGVKVTTEREEDAVEGETVSGPSAGAKVPGEGDIPF